MIEIFNAIFYSFWTFMGTLMLLAVVTQGTVALAAILKREEIMKKETYLRKNYGDPTYLDSANRENETKARGPIEWYCNPKDEETLVEFVLPRAIAGFFGFLLFIGLCMVLAS